MEQQFQRTTKLEKQIAEKQARATERRLKSEAKKKEELEKKASSAVAKEQQNSKKMTVVREVAKYPCLFDKSHLWYYMKDKKDAAWKKVQAATGDPKSNKLGTRLKPRPTRRRVSGDRLDWIIQSWRRSGKTRTKYLAMRRLRRGFS